MRLTLFLCFLISSSQALASVPIFSMAGLASAKEDSLSLFSDNYAIYRSADNAINLSAQHKGMWVHTSNNEGFEFSAQLGQVSSQFISDDLLVTLARTHAQANLAVALNEHWRLNLGTEKMGIGYRLGSVYGELNHRCVNQSAQLKVELNNQRRQLEIGRRCHNMLQAQLAYNDWLLEFNWAAQNDWTLAISGKAQQLRLWQRDFVIDSGGIEFDDFDLGWQAQNVQWQGAAIQGNIKRFGYFANYSTIEYEGEFDLSAEDEIIQNLAGGRYMLVNRLAATTYELGGHYSQPLQLLNQKFSARGGVSYAVVSGQGTASLYRNLLFIPLPVLRSRQALPEHNDALNIAAELDWYSSVGTISVKASQLIPIETPSRNTTAGSSDNRGGGSKKSVSGGTVLSIRFERKLN